MQLRPTLERRQHPRRDASLAVTYRPMVLTGRYDITHTRNISQGGMLLTTARPFAAGARLAIYLRLTSQSSLRLIRGTAETVESREIVQNVLYEIRVRFIDLDRRSFQIIGGFCAGEADQLAAPGRAAMKG